MMGSKIIFLFAFLATGFAQSKLFLSEQSNPLYANRVSPDVFDTIPNQVVTVSFGKVPVSLGNTMTTADVKNNPTTVSWEADPNKFYTLALIDPDAPSRSAPILGQWLHWLVVDIPGNNVLNGMTLSAYLPAGPPRWTGLHRMVFAVYEQPGKLNVSPDELHNNSNWNRIRFNIRSFAKKYNLGEPIAANFFQTQHERS